MKRIFSSPVAAAAAGICLRLFFVLKLPGSSGDTVLYEQIAANWLKYHSYAMNVEGAVTPVDVRMPGYPAYLALIYWLTGQTGGGAHRAAMLGQIAVDLLGCAGIAALAAALIVLADRQADPQRAFSAGMWVAALCPFTANYTAVLLTETFAICLTAVAFVLMVRAVFLTGFDRARDPNRAPWPWPKILPLDRSAILLGLVVGLGTLFRPEAPLLLAAAWTGCGLRAVKRRAQREYARVVVYSALGCLLMLAPWALRNALTLGELQLLAPRNSNLPGELVPEGFMAWEKTWLYRLRDCYLAPWKLNSEAIHVELLPARAFDSEQEKERVARILEKYNEELTLTQQADDEFGALARERKARHRLRTVLGIPAERAVTLWLTPRIELLPVAGNVFPLAQMREDDPVDQGTTAALFLLNLLYLGFATLGGWKIWRRSRAARPVLLTLGFYLLLRTAFLTTLETPEPRYVLVCYPVILALIASLAGWKPAAAVR